MDHRVGQSQTMALLAPGPPRFYVFLEGRLQWVLTTLGTPIFLTDSSDVMSVKLVPSSLEDVMKTLHTSNKANGQRCALVRATCQRWLWLSTKFSMTRKFNGVSTVHDQNMTVVLPSPS